METTEKEEEHTTARARQSMFVDTHVLYKSMAQIRARIAELEKQPELEAEKENYKKLYELVHEMYSKLHKSRSIRLDYW